MNAILKTHRLELRRFTLKDVKLFHQLNADAYIRKYLWDDAIIDEQKASEIIKQNNIHFKQDKFGLWKIYLNENRKVIGFVGLWYFFNELQPQLIYAILKKYTKRGYAHEASSSMIKYAFNNLNFEYLVAATDEPHIESQKVAERLGMTLNRITKESNRSTLFYKLEKKAGAK